jgi:hypothetical protein
MIEYLILAAVGANLVVSLVKLRPSRRHARREELATMAVDYAEMMGGPDKLKHAIQAFGRIDLADNGKRDYSDAEARIAIEALLARRK